MSCFLQLGSRGDSRIALIERKLKSLGYYFGIIDDYYGPVLNSAVQRFQANNGLQVDCVGPITWGKLFPSGTCSDNWLYRGCTGENVLNQQIVLQSLNYYVGFSRDKFFGPIMDSEVRRFQRDRGIVVDGIIGDQTIKEEILAKIKNPLPNSDGNCCESAQFAVWKQELNANTRRTCGPYAVKEALFEWGINPDIDFIVNHIKAGYGWDGTSPADIIAGVPKITEAYGIQCKAEYVNFSDINFGGLANILTNPNETCINHVAYKSNSCNHYNAPIRVCLHDKTITIAENLHGAFETYSWSNYLPYYQNCSQPSILKFTKL